MSSPARAQAAAASVPPVPSISAASAEKCDGLGSRGSADEGQSQARGNMRVLHALVAFFTVVLLFIQQKYIFVCAGPCSAKQSLPAWPHSSGDSSAATLPLLAADCVVCARAVSAARSHEERGRPKYKRDPEIAVDNEFIGYHPHDDDE